MIVPAMSFVASANCVLYQGGRPVFADLCRDTLNIDPADVERRSLRGLAPSSRSISPAIRATTTRCLTSLGVTNSRLSTTRPIPWAPSIAGNERDAAAAYHAELPPRQAHHNGRRRRDCHRRRIVRENSAVASTPRHRFGSACAQRRQLVGVRRRLAGVQLSDSGPQLRLGTSQLRKLDGWLARRRHPSRDTARR